MPSRARASDMINKWNRELKIGQRWFLNYKDVVYEIIRINDGYSSDTKVVFSSHKVYKTGTIHTFYFDSSNWIYLKGQDAI